jgi:threonine/homoserine/homoserine lactone efflux protein
MLLLDLLLGIFIAFVAALPSGPVNLAVFRTSLNGQRITALLIAMGGATSEMLYCFMGVGGAALVVGQQNLSLALQIASVPVMLAMGIVNLVKQHGEVVKAVESHKPSPVRKRGFFIGLGLNLLNPLLIPFWALVVHWLVANRWMTDEWASTLFFALGVFVGTFGLLFMVAEIAHAKRKAWSAHSLEVVNRIVGAVFIGFACYQGYHLVRQWIDGQV